MTLSSLAQTVKVRPIIEFHGAAEVDGQNAVRPNSRVYVIYNLRRYEDCSGTILRRWYDASEGVYDPQYEESFRVQKAPVSTRHRLWRLPLDVSRTFRPAGGRTIPNFYPARTA